MLPRILQTLLLSFYSLNALAATESLSDSLVVQGFIEQMVRQHKFDKSRLEKIFDQTELQQSILDAISRPAEGKPWNEYRPIFVTGDRTRKGVAFWAENSESLQNASKLYGVPQEIIVAIIGVETRYGKHAGRYSVLDALSTLAFAYPPRSAFFRKELTEYLLMTREEGIEPGQQLGSYAGAMGMPQFIPSSFRMYAIDFNKDGKRDIWKSTPDAIGSVANYFKRHHWKTGQPIASKVKVHGETYKKLLDQGLNAQYDQQTLLNNGVILPKGLPANVKGMLLELEGEDGPEYWVGWHNFYVISRYNHSALYSMAVYQLSRKINQANRESITGHAYP